MRSLLSYRKVSQVTKSNIWAIDLVDFESRKQKKSDKPTKAVDFDAQKQNEEEDAKKIQEDMLQMAQGMKEFAKGFQTQFKKDE